MPRNKPYIIALALLFLVIVLLTACSSGAGETEDKNKNQAQSSDAIRKSGETKKAELSECGPNEKCAKGGKKCKYGAVATEPEDCDEPPSLKCTCPASKECQSRFNRAGIKDWWCFA